MTRRQTFLRSGGAMFAAAVLAPPPAAAATDTVQFRLEACPLLYRPAPGVAAPSFAYDGVLPGPLLRVLRGQRVRIVYTNRAGIPTSVHWHGLIVPNAMDGVAGITQPAVPDGASFVYEFTPQPSGTRWYHDHAATDATLRGLFGMFVIDEPNDERADAEFAVVLHDVPVAGSAMAAMRGRSAAAMTDPADSIEMSAMHPGDQMGDEVAYAAHCINGAVYPNVQPLIVKRGQRVRLRILNANQSQTRYVRLAGHRLTVTHLDGNRLGIPVTCDAVRLGAAERCDAWFEVAAPGAWLLQTLTSAPLAFEQAVVVRTPDAAGAAPLASSMLLGGADVLTYERAGGGFAGPFVAPPVDVSKTLELEGGDYGGMRWTMNDKTWPDTERIVVHSGDDVLVRFRNMTDMEHPMHLHGHTFAVVEIGGRALRRPIAKDVSLIPANGGTLSWRFRADSPPGRWLLHCHNQIHMMDGMMTEVVYARRSAPLSAGD